MAIDAASDGVVVRCAGELDLSVAPELEQVLDRIISQGAGCRVDLTQVRFVDSTGLHRLADAVHRAAALGRPLRITPPVDRSVLRPVELLGLVDALPFTRAA